MKVIIINGPMGVGKTTAGKLIAEKNPGTAFIDGDWCMDLHPFVGNRETKAMAVDNILHMGPGKDQGRPGRAAGGSPVRYPGL